MENRLFDKKIDDIDAIKGYLESDIPVYLHGLSGDGKSARAKQIDPNLTILYLSNATPELINGKSVLIPAITKKIILPNGDIEEVTVHDSFMMDIKPTWLINLESKCQMEPDKIHILFFDELSNAMPTIQNFIFNIILNKEVNGKWKLPSNTRIIAAGNEMDESIVANEIAKPLYSRFAHLFIKTNINDWIKWAALSHMHPGIIAFHAMTNGKYLRSEYTGISPNADPRRFEMLSNLLYNTGSISSITSLLDQKICIEFTNFIYGQIIPLDVVINNNLYEEVKKYISRMSIEEKYLMVANYSLVDYYHFDKIREIIEKTEDDDLNLLFLLMVNANYKEHKVSNKGVK